MEFVVAIISLCAALWFYIKKVGAEIERDNYARFEFDLMNEKVMLKIENKMLKSEIKKLKKEVE